MNAFFIALFAFFVAYASAGTIMKDGLNTTSSNCGGNCPGNDCPSCPCGTSVKKVSIEDWCKKHDWNQGNCKCIVNHESGGNAHAMNYNAGQSSSYLWDVGLWQVNSYNWNACNGGKAPCDPDSSLKCAIDVYNWGGKTWKLWSTCGACGACNSH